MPNTIINTTKKLTGEWVGYLRDNEQHEFVRLSFDGQWCDLPQRNAFNAPITVGEDEKTVLVADWLRLQIEQNQSPQELDGQVGATDRFQLWPVTPIGENPNPLIGGAYRLDNDRDLFIAAEIAVTWPTWQLYYRDGDHHVRLYPLDAGTYLSERAELFTFAGDDLTIQTAAGEQSTGGRVTLYGQEAVTIAVAAGYQIAGSLLTPLQPAPHPTVILVHGAGPGLRDDYLMVADRFARQGMAVFVYDKRGWGESTGEQLWSDIPKLAGDATEIIRQIRSHPKVDATRVGVWGFSNGGWVAPLAASRFDDIAFVISFSGSGVPPARQEQIRRCNVARDTLGASAAQVELLWHFWEHVFRFEATGKWTPELERIIGQVESDVDLQALPKHEGYPEFLQPVPPKRTREEWLALGGQDPEMVLDPVPIFRDISAPILFVWGEKDSIVPAHESRDAIVAGLGDRDNYTVLMVPNGGHLFLIDETIHCHQPIGDEAQMLARVPRVAAPGLWDAITKWVHRYH